jgi:hypothetical protein
MSISRALLASVLAVAVVAGGGTALAQDKAAAETAFQRGIAAAKQAQWDQACAAFELSQELDAQIGTLFNLANCHEKLGKTATAWAEFREVAQRDSNAKRRKVAATRATALEPRLVKLLITVAPPAAGVRVTVTRDTDDVSRLAGTAFPVDPGSHSLRAEAAGYEAWSRTVEAIAEGKTVTVEVPALQPLPAAPDGDGDGDGEAHDGKDRGDGEGPGDGPGIGGPGDGGDGPGAGPGSSGLGTRRIAAIATGGAGIVALGVGAFFGLRAMGQHDDADDHCDDSWACDPEGYALSNDAKDSAQWSTIGVAVGVGALGAATYLWLSGGESRDPAALGVTPIAGAGELGLMIHAGF